MDGVDVDVCSRKGSGRSEKRKRFCTWRRADGSDEVASAGCQAIAVVREGGVGLHWPEGSAVESTERRRFDRRDVYNTS